MSKLWIWLIAIGGIILFIGASIINYNKYVVNDSESITQSQVLYFKDVQYQDNDAVLQAYAVGKSFTKITYKIDNGAEVDITGAVVDTADKDWEFYKKAYAGKKYIDSRVITIDLSRYEVGDHFITIYVYDGSTSKEEIYKKFFKLVE